MRSSIRIVFAICCPGLLLNALAQDVAPRSGYAVVTLVSGNVAGLVATETLRSPGSAAPAQAVLAPSPLVTSASLLVPVGPLAQNTTAIALANPSTGAGAINLVLTDTAGNVFLNTNVVLGPREQLSEFLNDFFAIPPAGFSPAMLLTISSEIPVGIVALNFRDGGFTSIPLTSLSTPIPVAVQPAAPVSTSVSGSPQAGFGIGLPAPPPVPRSPVPVTVTTSPVPTTSSIGGGASMVFPQVVIGFNWSTEIALGNTSTATQIARIDFFDPGGFQIASFTNVLVPARGTVVLSAADAGAPSP